MNLFKKIFFILIFLFLSVTFLKAEDKVSYIDIDYLLSNTLAGKELLNKLKKEEQLKIEQFKTNDKNFKNEENKILAKRNLISKDEINKELKLLQVKFQKYNKEKKDEVDQLKDIMIFCGYEYITISDNKNSFCFCVIGVFVT